MAIMYVLYWLCIYSGGETGNNEIWSFKIKFNTGHSQSLSKTIGISNKVFCTSGPNLVILARMGDELWHWQAFVVIHACHRETKQQ